MRLAPTQAPGKCTATGTLKNVLVCADVAGMALWGDRMALSQFADDCSISVFDLNGLHLDTFGTVADELGQVGHATRLCTHPNGNLLVLNVDTRRVVEVTWSGAHVRLICSFKMNKWRPKLMAVSPEGSRIAVLARHTVGLDTVEILDGNTCAPIRRLGSAPFGYRHDMRFSPDGNGLVLGGSCRCKPMMFGECHGKTVHVGTQFGVMSSTQHVDFTDGGDIILCGANGASVYSGETLEHVRSWAWPDAGQHVSAMQAHRGLLYVRCTSWRREEATMYVYE